MSILREYKPDDFNDLWRLDQQCFPPGISYSRFELMHYIRRRGSFTLVAETDGKIAGFLVAECRANVRARSDSTGQHGVGHVITIDVATTAQRTGIGNQLMDAAEGRMQAAGCEAVYLETAVNNESAIAFYKRRSYSVLSTIPRYYNGELDALVMGKKLRKAESYTVEPNESKAEEL